MSSSTPLLAGQQQPPYTSNDEPSKPPSRPHSPSRHRTASARSLREMGLFAWALLATAAFVLLAVWTQHRSDTSRSAPPPPGKRNLVFMVSDGMGPASLSLARSFRQFAEHLPRNDTLALDRHLRGTSRTRSSSSLVTDSAAGATAFSCGRKSYNGAVAVLPDYRPCGTVLEAAKRAGYHTGLVVTTNVTDATPACFASHALIRLMQDDIALQEVGEGPLGRVVDLVFGGGRCHFLPNSTDGSCRADDVDVVSVARRKHGWHYADDRAGFDRYDGGEVVDLPALGLFATTNVPFELDRRGQADVYPSLSEMAATALRALEKATEGSDRGFFLMIEGSRIDHAAHINDPAAHVREVLEYDETFRAVLDFLEQSPTEGVLVSTSDHETGGLSVALQEPGHLPVYGWYPAALQNASASAEFLFARLQSHLASAAPTSGKALRTWIDETLVKPGLGIHDAHDDELDALVEYPGQAINIFADMVSLRAHVGWATHGHSAVDVNIYSSDGPAVDALRGNVENIEIGEFLARYLDVDVDAITDELRDASAFGVGENSEETVKRYLAAEAGNPHHGSIRA